VFAAAFAVRKTVLPGFALACAVASAYLGRGGGCGGVTALAGLVLIAHRKNLMTELANFLERRNVHAKHNSPET
jgi:hypothetical protein